MRHPGERVQKPRHSMPASVDETAIYSEGDGVVDSGTARQTVPTRTSEFRAHTSDLFLIPPHTSVIAKRLAQSGSEGSE